MGIGIEDWVRTCEMNRAGVWGRVGADSVARMKGPSRMVIGEARWGDSDWIHDFVGGLKEKLKGDRLLERERMFKFNGGDRESF